MRLRVEVGQTLRHVVVQHRDGLFHVTIDGHTHVVDAVRVDGATLSLLLHDGGAARSVAAAVAPAGTPGGFEVYVRGRAVPVRLANGIVPGRRREVGAAGSGPQRVVAPMPGKVVRVLVAPGETVQPRQGLVVVEAMKMENELRAARAGRVREVAVVQGQAVDAGAVLVVVD